MKCVVCRHGETKPGTTTLVLQRGDAAVVINDVPAQVCENCGEDYVDEQVAERALADADTATRAGVRLEVRDFKAA
jgi:YgiT-type zinc finger domain-containing protein